MCDPVIELQEWKGGWNKRTVPNKTGRTTGRERKGSKIIEVREWAGIKVKLTTHYSMKTKRSPETGLGCAYLSMQWAEQVTASITAGEGKLSRRKQETFALRCSMRPWISVTTALYCQHPAIRAGEHCAHRGDAPTCSLPSR